MSLTCPTSTPPSYIQSHPIASSTDTIIRSTPWFIDGSLIIYSPPVQFKVYAGILAARSSVFNDMLAFRQPKENENETVEGCAVVTLFGDDPADVKWFLMALLDTSFFELPPTPTTLPIISAILRLSRKYNVPYLHNRALSHLHTTFPTTLEAFNNRERTRTIPPVTNTPFAALLLAREMELDWIVPSVVYCICSHPVRRTLRGAWWLSVEEEWNVMKVDEREEDESKDDEDEMNEEEDEDEDDRQERTGIKIGLSESDRNMVLSARAKIKEMQVKAMASLVNAQSVNCHEASDALNDTIAAVAHILGFAHTPNPPPIPVPASNPPSLSLTSDSTIFICLYIRLSAAQIVTSTDASLLNLPTELGPLLKNMCPPCREELLRVCECLSREMWDALPGFCGLGSWEVLEARRKEGL